LASQHLEIRHLHLVDNDLEAEVVFGNLDLTLTAANPRGLEIIRSVAVDAIARYLPLDANTGIRLIELRLSDEQLTAQLEIRGREIATRAPLDNDQFIGVRAAASDVIRGLLANEIDVSEKVAEETAREKLAYQREHREHERTRVAYVALQDSVWKAVEMLDSSHPAAKLLREAGLA